MWVAYILKGIAASGKYFLDIVTGRVVSIEIDEHYCSIHEIDRYAKANVNVFHALSFAFKKTITSRRLGLRNDFHVVHHMLPFSIGVTFDLDFIFKSGNKKYILGPVQNPQTFAAADESVAEAPYNKFLIRVFKRFLGYLSDLTLKNADSVVVINRQTKEMLLERGVEEQKIKVIHPGIDLDKFRYTPFNEKDSGTVEVITVGFLIERKAVDLIIRAIGEVAKYHRNLRLRIIGDGPQMGSLKGLSDSLGLSEYITFQGHVPNYDVWEYYRKAHIYVSMSRSESWGQVYLEAMATGLPVVSAVNVGSSCIIEDGEFGFLVDQGDYKMLARRLLQLIENRDLLADFGRKGRAEVERKYDWKAVIIPQYIEVYESLTGRRQDDE
ncbi:MAG: glycosyltransferase [Actinobacteria bacterium]|nr:glycosyltransferase [Actinomycetota bacterium]